MKKSLSNGAIALMHVLMADKTIQSKVELAPGEGISYARYDITDTGATILGETRFRFWNQLLHCQYKLSFEAWALAVWDALVDLSTGPNARALENELSTEIAKKAQRKEEYEWVIKRLYDCYEHVTNGNGGASSEGDQGDKGSSMTEHRTVICNGEPITINVNADKYRKTFRFPDATGRAFLNFDLGVVGVRVDHD